MMSVRNDTAQIKRQFLERGLAHLRWASLWVIFGLGTCTPTVFSQNVPPGTLPDAGRLLQEQKQNPVPGLEKKEPTFQLPGPNNTQLRPGFDQKIAFRRFEFVGELGTIQPDELQSLVQSTKPELTFAEILELADKVSEYIRSQGYSFASALVPAQDVTNGVVQIMVLLGKIENLSESSNFQVRDAKGNPGRLRPKVARNLLKNALAPHNGFLRLSGMERGILLINDLPGVEVRTSLESGSATGAVRLKADINEGPLFSGLVWGDNQGNRYTGATRINGSLNVNDATGWGDQINLQLTRGGRLEVNKLSLAVPLGSSGLKASTSGTYLKYSIGKNFSNLGLKGDASTLNVQLSYPIMRSRVHTLNASLSHDKKSMVDEALEQATQESVVTKDRRINVTTLGLDGNRSDAWMAGGVTSYGMSITSGRLNLSRVPTALNNDLQGPQTEGSFLRANYTLSRSQRLNSSFSFFASLSGQKAQKNLEGSEEFSLGGSSGIRAYPSGEGSGDEGWLATLEGRYNFPETTWMGDIQTTIFYDVGHVQINKRPFALTSTAATNRPESFYLKGAGFSVSLSQPGQYVVRATFAHKIGTNPGASAVGTDSDGMADRYRWWLQAIWFF
jgi:hemolysin activation/secretion protein